MSAVPRGVAAAAAGAVAAAVLVAAGVAGAQEPTPVDITAVDAAAYPTVTAVVTAPPGLGGTGYAAGAFEVLEDGHPVEATVERMPTSNLEVMLVLDTSGSMEGAPLAAAREAAGGFLDVLPPEVRVGVVGFGPTARLLAAPTGDRAAVAGQLAGLRASGETALYDAVVHATSQFSAEASDRAVVLLSDGGDTASAADLEQAAAAAAGATVNVIELVTPESNRAALDRLAAAGGGTVSAVSDPAALAELYDAAARALANRYRVAYTSAGRGTAALTVRLDTGAGVHEASRSVALPAAPSGAGGGEPAAGDAAPAEGAGARQQPRSLVARAGLVAGAGAVFLALLCLGLVALPGGGTRRLTAARLGATHAVADGPSVSQVTQRVANAAEQLLERQGRRQGLAAALEVAGISLRTGEYVVLAGTGTVVAALAGLALAGGLGLLLGLAIGPLAAWSVVNVKADRRRSQFAEVLPDNLQLLTSSVRAGYGLMHALDTLGREAAEPARSEFRRVMLEVRVGRDPGDAMRALAERMRSDDFEWVVGAIEINREVGGDLAAILDNVAETIRERQRLNRQVRTLTAEGRISGWVLTALPPVLAAALAILNPDYIGRLTSGPGLVLVAMGTGMLAVGWVWMRALTRSAF
ncbi:MAG TPA: type II secretion system F family protein [Acidimicrobiales bacterium]